MQLLDDILCALDPTRWVGDVLGITLDPWQADVLSSEARQSLLNASRQSGKSTVAAMKALHRATYHPGSLSLIVSPSLRQSAEMFRKVMALVDSLPARPVLKEDTSTSFTMATGSRVVSLPSSEATVRGYSAADLLIVDEASRVPDDLYRATRPMVAVSGGAILALSTPWGKRGWWYEAWTHGGNLWQRYEIQAMKCPRIPSDFLKSERQSMGEMWFRSEYLCEFTDTELSVFATADIEAAFVDSPIPALFGGR